MRIIVLAVAGILITGCCYFVPCHPSTKAVGSVLDLNGHPVAEAEITLYGYRVNSNQNGCFSIGQPDALPFEILVTAAGFKPITTNAERGFQKITVVLAPEGSPNSSSLKWQEISESEYVANKNRT